MMKKYRDGGIYTAEMGQPPQDIDGGSAPTTATLKNVHSLAGLDNANVLFCEDWSDLDEEDNPTYILVQVMHLAQTVVTEKANIQISQDGGALLSIDAAPKLSDVVKALNALGATPQDLVAILQAIKAAGALNAELEVI
jgi:hypothetical protein